MGGTAQWGGGHSTVGRGAMGQQGWGAQWGWGWWGGGDWGAQRCPHPIGPPRVLIPPPHIYPIASPTFPPPHPLLPPPIYPPRAAPPPPFSPSAPQRPPPAPHGVPWPRSGPWGADVQHGGGGHREGRRTAAPHPAALPALPGEFCFLGGGGGVQGGVFSPTGGVLSPTGGVFSPTSAPIEPTLTPQAVECRAVPLPGGEEVEYMLALKQELRGAMKGLPYFVRPGAPHRGMGRTHSPSCAHPPPIPGGPPDVLRAVVPQTSNATRINTNCPAP